MKRYLFSIFAVSLIVLIIENCDDVKNPQPPNDDLCNALIENDRGALNSIFTGYLNSVDLRSDHKENFEQIKNWLQEHECVQSVEIVTEVLDTEPPIKELIITLEPKETVRSIGFKIYKDELRFDFK